MPETEKDILELFKQLERESGGQIKALIEGVHASAVQSPPKAFAFGKNYGSLRMALIAARISFEEIAPAKWQLIMGCRTQGNKNVSKAKAQQLFPELKIGHAVADALLIAECLKRLEENSASDMQQLETAVLKCLPTKIPNLKVDPIVFDL